MLAGPPCETWSQARGKSLSFSSASLQRRAPRIIRDRTCLWGRAALALRELEQLNLGNLLLLFTIEMLIHLAVQGGVGAMEHPAPPNDDALASVWHLLIIRYLCTWPEFLRIELAQGLWGANSPKPTSLLLLNLPDMPQVLRHWQITKCLPAAKSIGQNADGSWRTSQLKEYPPALCAGLAQGLFEAINEHKVDPALAVDGDFRAHAMRLTVSSYGSHIGPDFAPHGWGFLFSCIWIWTALRWPQRELQVAKSKKYIYMIIDLYAFPFIFFFSFGDEGRCFYSRWFQGHLFLSGYASASWWCAPATSVVARQLRRWTAQGNWWRRSWRRRAGGHRKSSEFAGKFPRKMGGL